MKETIKKQISGKTAVLLFGLALLFLLSGCSDSLTGPGSRSSSGSSKGTVYGKGTIVLNLGSASSAAYSHSASIAYSAAGSAAARNSVLYATSTPGGIKYVINIYDAGSNNGKLVYGPEEVIGSGRVTIEIAPGSYRINITQYRDGEKYAEGSSVAQVRLGQSSSVTIALQLTAPDTPVWITYYEVADFANWLYSLDANDVDNPYKVKLNVNGLGGNFINSDSVGDLLRINNDIFVILDLSGSTLTNNDLPYAFSDPDNPTGPHYCSNLVGIIFPSTITEIGYNAFHTCSSLKSVTIPDSVLIIKGGAFTNCTSLESITIPAYVHKIENNAFAGCTGLKKVIFLGSNITTIEPGAGASTLPGDLRAKYLATDGGAGTYEKQDDGSWKKTS